MFSIALAFVGISLLCKVREDRHSAWSGLLLSFIILVLCYLYSWRKPFFPEGYAYSQAYFLCPAFRPVCLCGAIEVLYRTAAYPYTLVMGERSFTGCFPTVISLVTMTKAIHYIGSTPLLFWVLWSLLQLYSSEY